MIQAKKHNDVELSENRILSCDTNGIYVQGRNSKPMITNNYFGYCRKAAIATNLDVNGIIVGNSIEKNEVGIELFNNCSKVIYNTI